MYFLFMMLFWVTIHKAAHLSLEDIKKDTKILFQGTDFFHEDKKMRDDFFWSGDISEIVRDNILSPTGQFSYLKEPSKMAIFSDYCAKRFDEYDSLFVLQMMYAKIPEMQEIIERHKLFIHNFLKNSRVSALDIPADITINISWSEHSLFWGERSDLKSFLVIAAQQADESLFMDLLTKGADPQRCLPELFKYGRYECLKLLKNLKPKKEDQKVLSSFLWRMKDHVREDDNKILALLLSMDSSNYPDKARQVFSALLNIKVLKIEYEEKLSDCERNLHEHIYQELYPYYMQIIPVICDCITILETEKLPLIQAAQLKKGYQLSRAAKIEY